jgi:amino acid transporter
MNGDLGGGPAGRPGTDQSLRTAPGAPERLKANSVSLLGTIGIAVGPQAPTGGINLLPAIMASIVAGAASLSFLLGLVAMIFVAYAFVIFARRIASAGQLYTYTGVSVGSGYGAVTGFAWMIAFIAVAAWLSIQDGDYLVALFQPLGVTLPWLWMSALMWLVMVVLTFRSMELSAITVVLVEAVGVTLMFIVAAFVIAHGGYAGHSLSWRPLTPQGQSFTTVMAGVVFAFTSFSGFESAGSLGEEARRPKWAIPVAIFSALIISGTIYVFMTWVETVGFASPAVLAHQTTPLVTIAGRYLGSPMRTVMNIAALISGFGAQLACLAAAARVLYALGRDSLAPRARGRFTRLHPRFGTPVVPFALASLLSGVIVFAFAFAGPLGSITDVSSYGADIEILVYLLVVIAALVFCWKHERKLQHFIVLIIGVVVMGYIVKDTVYPIPPAPLNYAMYAAFATFALGIAILLVFPGMRSRLSASKLFHAGSLSEPANSPEVTQ